MLQTEDTEIRVRYKGLFQKCKMCRTPSTHDSILRTHMTYLAKIKLLYKITGKDNEPTTSEVVNWGH